MSRKNKPICFIAMAFGHKDTDDLYDTQILPILKRNGLQPIRIDRRESNDDLNNQIIEQLKIADVCVTDLSYARQSVYYEAGFAQRSVPVIYTVRKDHLKPGQPDDLRVHFDLQMKPIIPWEAPNDSTFSAKLEKRIRSTFLNNWSREERINRKISEANIEFENKGVAERLQILRRRTILALRPFGFIASSWFAPGFFNDIEGPYMGSFRNARNVTRADYFYLCASITRDNKARFVSVQAYDSMTQQAIRKIENNYYSGHYILYYGILDEDIFAKNYLDITFNHFLLSQRPVPTERIESALSGAKPLERGKCYSDTISIEEPHLRDEHRKVKTVPTTWHFLTGIRSEIDLNEALQYQLRNHFKD